MPTDAPAMLPLLMRDTDVATALACDRRSVWRLLAKGTLPPPVSIPGTRSTRWRRSDIEAFVQGMGGETDRASAPSDEFTRLTGAGQRRGVREAAGGGSQ